MTQPTRSIYELTFTEQDLALNRTGKVSESQRERLIAHAKQTRRSLGWGIVVFAVIVALGIGYEFLRAGGTLELFQRRQTPFVLLLIGMFLFILILLTVISMVTTRALKDPKISYSEGAATVEALHVDSRSMGNYTAYIVRVGGLRMRFYYSQSAAQFQQGVRYRVYTVRVPTQPYPIPLSAERI